MRTKKTLKAVATPKTAPAPPPKKSSVILVDDHPVVREGLARVIEQEADLEVCDQAKNAIEALQKIESSQPDIAVIDVTLDGSHGIELVKDLKIRFPHLPILMLSMHDESLYAERSLRAGAKGYIMKQQPPQELVKAIRQVLRGEVYLSEAMTRQMLYKIAGESKVKGSSPSEVLSDREFDVFELIGQVRSTSQIATLLHLSVKTIQTHREHIKQKLNLADGVSLVRYAVQWVGAQKGNA
jgi:DNA-binding NarL/FixJ family response regulator